MELIDKKKVLRDLYGIKDVLVGQGDPFLVSVMTRAIDCVERQVPVSEQDTGGEIANYSDLAEDDALAKALEELKSAFHEALSLDYVYNKIGWALYHTWSKHR